MGFRHVWAGSVCSANLLRKLFETAVAAVDPLLVVPPHLPPPPKGRTIVIGAGKASARMALAVERHWHHALDGLVVTRYGHGAPCSRIEIVEAGHPVPDEAGQTAAARDTGNGARSVCRGSGDLPDIGRRFFIARFACAWLAIAGKNATSTARS